MAEFSVARRIAETVRYLDDPPQTGPELEGSQGEVPDFLNAFGRNALRITSQVAPELNSIITTRNCGWYREAIRDCRRNSHPYGRFV